MYSELKEKLKDLKVIERYIEGFYDLAEKLDYKLDYNSFTVLDVVNNYEDSWTEFPKNNLHVDYMRKELSIDVYIEILKIIVEKLDKFEIVPGKFFPYSEEVNYLIGGFLELFAVQNNYERLNVYIDGGVIIKPWMPINVVKDCNLKRILSPCKEVNLTEIFQKLLNNDEPDKVISKLYSELIGVTNGLVSKSSVSRYLEGNLEEIKFIKDNMID